MVDGTAGSFEIPRQNVAHYFRGPYAHTGITVHQGRFQGRYGLWHLHEAERFYGPDADRRRLVVCQNLGEDADRSGILDTEGPHILSAGGPDRFIPIS